MRGEQFVILRDETGLVQITLPKQQPPAELNEAISALTVESAITVIGTVMADERVKLGGLELRPERIEVDSLAELELPIAADSALDKRIDWRYLDLRRPERRLIFEVQTTVEHAMREFWRKQGFIELHSPKLMGSASEHLGLRLSLALGALVSCGFWLATRLRHKNIAVALEEAPPATAGRPAGVVSAERGA